ncbi:MAG: ABC transporter ATP-binding protein, partial [Oscillospiraceae bacterium]|nr:ABC transporter ATP-binding protein [Oscillospiraceae bacterium]
TTLMQADQILVLDKGRAADLGTHGELAARPGIYQEICDIQMSRDDRALIEEGGDA